MKTKEKIPFMAFSLILAVIFTVRALDPGINLNQTGLMDSSLFDFQVGEWKLWRKDSNGDTGIVRNVVVKLIDDRVISKNG